MLPMIKRIRAWMDDHPEMTILGLAALIYLPFFPFRTARIAGDEKVYIQQLLEMREAGAWFVQTLFDEPNYYKPPLFFLLNRVTTSVFGLNGFAIVFFNWVSIALGTIAVFRVVQHRLGSRDLALSSAIWFSTGLGLYAHAFAAQMEVLLVGPIAWILYLLDRENDRGDLFQIWLWIGLLSWIKSPLHSVFLGTSALLFWAATGSIGRRVRSSDFYLSGVIGVGVALLPFLPIVFLDGENFYRTFILREHASKSQYLPFWDPIRSTFGFYLLPFIGLALAAYGALFVRVKRVWTNKNYRRLFLLSVSGFAPSLLFFMVFTYRFENYHLPVFGAVVLLMALGLALVQEMPRSEWVTSIAFAPTWLLYGVGYSGFAALIVRLGQQSDWLPVAGMVSILTFSVLLIGLSVRYRLTSQPLWKSFATVALSLVSLGAIFVVVGERELADLRALPQNERDLGYFNRQKNIWNEAGMLHVFLASEGFRVKPLVTNASVSKTFDEGKWILVHRRRIHYFKKWIKKHKGVSLESLESHPWSRWALRGLATRSRGLAKAWELGSSSPFEAQYGLFRKSRTESPSP